MQYTLTQFKREATVLYDRIVDALKSASKKIPNIRIKIIGIKTFDIDGASACIESRFFKIQCQEENSKYIKFLYQLIANGNGDCVDTITALSLAIKSDWTLNGDKQRHIVVLITDISANKLEDANRSNPYYPKNTPVSFEELTDTWLSPTSGQTSKIKLKQSTKRLIVFAPQMYPWPEIYESWDQVVYNPFKASVSYEDIINAIVGYI